MDVNTAGGAAQKAAKEMWEASKKAAGNMKGPATAYDAFKVASSLDPDKTSYKVLGAISSGGAFLKKAMDKDMGMKDAFNSVYKNSGGQLNWGNLAGTAFGVSAAARVASGGGLYRNSKGEVDLIGVPFI